MTRSGASFGISCAQVLSPFAFAGALDGPGVSAGVGGFGGFPPYRPSVPNFFVKSSSLDFRDSSLDPLSDEHLLTVIASFRSSYKSKHLRKAIVFIYVTFYNMQASRS